MASPNCDDIFDTGLRGAKADFSFDGKYVAFHVAEGRYAAARTDVVVVDVKKRTVRNVTASLAGSSLFPSWTKDGRLCFRYDGDDYRGFIMATRRARAAGVAAAAVAGTELPATRGGRTFPPRAPRRRTRSRS